MSEIDLRQLQYFVAAAESGSFVKAARLVSVSQPAITKSIQRMEEWFAHPLFKRGMELQLTEFGKELIPHARSILEKFDELHRTAEHFGGVHTSTIRVGAGPMIAEALIGKAVGKMIAANPGVRVVVNVDNYQVFPTLLLEQKIDLFIADVTAMNDAGPFAILKLKPRRMRWFCRKGHPLATRKQVSFADILEFPVVLPELPIWAREWFASQMPQGMPFSSVHPPFHPTALCSHFPSLCRMVFESNAISGITASELRREPYASDFEIIDFCGETPTWNVGIVTLKRGEMPAVGHLLIEQVIAISEES